VCFIHFHHSLFGVAFVRHFLEPHNCMFWRPLWPSALTSRLVRLTRPVGCCHHASHLRCSKHLDALTISWKISFLFTVAYPLGVCSGISVRNACVRLIKIGKNTSGEKKCSGPKEAKYIICHTVFKIR